MRGRLDGNVGLVTGSGQGFGRGIARVLAREGAVVWVNDLSGDNARRVVDDPVTVRTRPLHCRGHRDAGAHSRPKPPRRPLVACKREWWRKTISAGLRAGIARVR